MATVASFNVALIASSGRFIGAISQADRRWMQFARNIQRETRRMPESMRQVTNASLTMARTVAKAFAVVGAVASGAGAWGVRLAAQYEQTQIAFATMLGSMQEADHFLRFLEERARRTPFGFVQLQELARSLLAWGFVRHEIERMIDPIGNFVAAMGGGSEHMERIVRALGQIRGRGKLASQEMLQLTEVGVPAWAYLAEQLGVTVPEAMEMTTRGMIDAETAIQAILRGLAEDPRFVGAMERQANTILGRWEQVKDSLTTITRGLGQDIIRIAGLGGALERLAQSVGRFADAVSSSGGLLAALRESFPPWLPTVIFAIAGAIGGSLVPVIVAALIPALRRLAVSLGVTSAALARWAGWGAVVALAAWYIVANWDAVVVFARKAWAGIAAAAMYGASLIVRAVGWIIYGVSILVPPLRGTAQAVLGWADSLHRAASQAWASAQAVASTAKTTQAAAESAERLAETADEAAKAQDGLGDATKRAAKSAAANIQSFDEVHQIQKDMADSGAEGLWDMDLPEVALPNIESPFVDVAKAIEEMGRSISQSLLGPLADVAIKLVGLEAILKRLRQFRVVRLAVEVVGNGIHLIPRLLEWMRNLRPVRWTLEVAGKGLELVGRVVEWIRNLRPVRWTFEVAGKGVEMVGRVVEWVRNLRPVRWAVEVVGNVGEILPRVLEWVGKLRPVKWTINVGGNVLEWLGKALGLFGRLGSLVSKALNPILRFVAPIGQFLLLIDVGKTLLDLVQRLPGYWDEFKNAIQRVVDGIKLIASGDIIEGLKTAFSGVGDILVLPFKIAIETIDSFLGHFFGRELWAKIKGWLGNIAASIGEAWNTIASWTSEKWGAITSTIGTWLDTARQWVSDRWGAIKTRIGEIWDGIKQWAIDKWTAITTIIGTWVDTAQTKVTTTWEAIKGAVGLAWETIKTWASEKWQAAVTAITNWVNNAKQTVEGTWNTVKTTLGTIWDTIRNWAGEKWEAIVAKVREWVETGEKKVTGTWETIKKTLGGIWESIKQKASDTWRGIANTVIKFINGIIDGVNGMIRALNRIQINIPDWVPGLGGKSFGFNLATIGHVPYLAKGGVITGSGLAVVGEAGPELLSLPRGASVTPLSGGGTVEDAVYRAVYAAFRDAARVERLQGGPSQDMQVILEMDGQRFARALIPRLAREQQRTGFRLIPGEA